MFFATMGSMPRTKIICTIGPASNSEDKLRSLIVAGMNIARLNLSHGTHEEHAKVIGLLRKIDSSIAVLSDLQGPRIRTGLLIGQRAVELKTGDIITLTGKQLEGDSRQVSISPGSVIADIKVGDQILIADATIELKVISKNKLGLKCKIVDGGVLSEHKGVNLPKTKLSLPSITAKDKRDLEWAIKNKVDYIGLSFVRQAKDILAVKQVLKRHKVNIPVIAKLEKPEAIDNLEAIVAVADAIMVARGDLGLEMSLEKVPEIQKKVIALCRKACKPVIVATQMLESMVDHEHPTRAEVSDVANAIFDGTDVVMLSEETSVGQDPVRAVKTMVKIIAEAENDLQYQAIEPEKNNLDLAVAHSACVLANTLKAKAIVTFTETGSTALRVAKQRPSTPVFGVVINERALRRLALYFGVQPVCIKSFKYIDQMISHAESAIKKVAKLRKHDLVVITAGIPTHVPGITNLVKVHRVGEEQSF